MVGKMIYNYKLKLKRGPRNNVQIYDTPQGGKVLLKFVIIRCKEEIKLVNKRDSSSRKFITSHKAGFHKPFENQITCNDERVVTTKTPRPTQLSNSFSTVLSPLSLWKCQLLPRLQGRAGRTL